MSLLNQHPNHHRDPSDAARAPLPALSVGHRLSGPIGSAASSTSAARRGGRGSDGACVGAKFNHKVPSFDSRL
jgi:hypothetical protein